MMLAMVGNFFVSDVGFNNDQRIASDVCIYSFFCIYVLGISTKECIAVPHAPIVDPPLGQM